MNLFIFSDTISDPSRLSIVSITWVEHFGNVCERKSSIHGWSLYWDFQSLRFRRYTYVLKNEKVILLCLKFTFSRSRQSNRSSEPCCHYRHWWKTRSWLRVTWWPTAFNNSWEPNLSLWQLGFGRYCSKFTFNYIFFLRMSYHGLLFRKSSLWCSNGRKSNSIADSKLYPGQWQSKHFNNGHRPIRRGRNRP